MDKDREIRFLYPPSIFIVSLVLGMLFEPNRETLSCILEKFPCLGTTHEIRIIDLIIALFGGSFFILTFGFLIGSITINLMRLLFLFSKHHYETAVNDEAYNRIWGKIFPTNNKSEIKQELYTVATYDHSMIDKDIHIWLRRRWNAFNVSANSALSLLIAFIVGCCFLNFSCWWGGIVIFFLIILLLNARKAWKETMEMLEFQSRK